MSSFLLNLKSCLKLVMAQRNTVQLKYGVCSIAESMGLLKSIVDAIAADVLGKNANGPKKRENVGSSSSSLYHQVIQSFLGGII